MSRPESARSPLVLRGDLLRALSDANAVQERAERDAQAILARAEGEAAEMRAAGRQEGIDEAGRLLADAGRAVENFIAAHEESLAALAFAVAERILGTFPREQQVLRAVTQALAEHRADAALALRVAPDLLEPLRAALAARDGEAVTLSADPTLDGTACTMIHATGRTAIGPMQQLAALRAASDRNP